jgi:hypothetical protein
MAGSLAVRRINPIEFFGPNSIFVLDVTAISKESRVMAKYPTSSKSSKLRRSGVKITPHPITSKLLAELDAPVNMVPLVGYFGPSKKDGYMRLYADLSFSGYYEIPIDDIFHAEPSDPKDENSPTMVLVTATAKLEVVTTKIQTIEACYLQGSIASQYLWSASPSFPAPDQAIARGYPGDLAPSTRQGCDTVFWMVGCEGGGGEGGEGGGGGGGPGGKPAPTDPILWSCFKGCPKPPPDTPKFGCSNVWRCPKR